VNLNTFWQVLALLQVSLATGQLDQAAQIGSVALTTVALEAEAVGLYYGPRYPSR
jgi:hypothetical protein